MDGSKQTGQNFCTTLGLGGGQVVCDRRWVGTPNSHFSKSFQGQDLYLDVSKNSGIPKSSILIGFSTITIHFGVPLFLETPFFFCRAKMDTWHMHVFFLAVKTPWRSFC